MNDLEREALLNRAAGGELTPEEAGELLEACRKEPGLRTKFAAVVAIERLLCTIGNDPTGEFAAREVVTRIRNRREPLPAFGMIVKTIETAHRRLWLRRLIWAGAVMAVLVALAGAGVWFWSGREPRTAATLARVEGVSWRGSQPEAMLHNGSRLIAQRGLFEVRFESGATVVVEAPADLEVENSRRAYLRMGRAVASVPKQARGFTLDSPRGPLVDLGTEFGVAVGTNGTTEVHVLDGIVEASLNRAAPVQLRESEALRATGGATQRLHADEGAFVTTLPPVTNRPPNFIHWSFDGDDDKAFANTGVGLGNGKDTQLYPRFLKSAGPDGPKLVPGKFGNALSFDGVNDYAESPFPGITGKQPRTIAFWVKVPHDFRLTQGYGIISWGEFYREGAAWQISANPAPESGLLGRLRVGTKSGYVVGTTDLRDDQWHHCAVVMYGGPRPTTGTHILLYVDGQLEASPRKSVQDILTVPSSAHGVWMGRNLGFTKSVVASDYAFLRGCVDEVYIFDGALSQRDIETLMLENTPP